VPLRESLPPCRATGHEAGDIAQARMACQIEPCEINTVEPVADWKETLTAKAYGWSQSSLCHMFLWHLRPSM